MPNRWLGWAALMVFTGVATVFLRRYADPWIPQGEVHAMLSAMFVVVVWPALAWLLRSFARFGFWDLLSWFSRATLP